jgi:hypothetical protein
MKILQQLTQFKGSQIVGLDTLVKVELAGGRSNPHQGKVTKLMEGSLVMLFKNGSGYHNMVNRRLKKQAEEGVFLTEDLFSLLTSEWKPGPRAWGERVKDTPFITHKGNMYLECIFLKAGKVKYFLDGVEAPKDQIIGLKEKEEGHQGGLTNKVIIRTFAIESILKIRKSKREMLGPKMA